MSLETETKTVIDELLEKADIKPGQIFVLGASSSEIAGGVIGHASSPDIAGIVFPIIHAACRERGVYLAVQCCEHLNRALIIESECAKAYSLDPVCVVPKPKAGGSFATCAWASFDAPCAVEHIRAHAGLDIGGTLIGMHLRDVAVPLRLSLDKIGGAHILCARTRPKYIGGSRAVYE